MLGTIRIACIALILVVSINSCAQSGDSFIKVLPKDWPIPQLQFNGDIKVYKAYAHGLRRPSDGGLTSTTYCAWVHCKGRDEVYKYTESQLGPLGYLRRVTNIDNDPNNIYTRTYLSPKGNIEVTIVDDVTPANEFKEKKEELIRHIQESGVGYFDKAQEFLIIITVSNSISIQDQERLAGSDTDSKLLPIPAK